MFKTEKSFITKFIIVAIIALLIPILSYTIFQFTQRTKEEALIKSIYEQQLNTVLFSVNQHCWDIFRSWSSELNTVVNMTLNGRSQRSIESVIRMWVNRQSSVSGIFIRFSEKQTTLVLDQSDAPPTAEYSSQSVRQRLESILQHSESAIQAMIEQAQKGYVRPLTVKWDGSSRVQMSLLVFPILVDGMKIDEPVLGGIFLNQRRFVLDIVARKFDEMDEANLIFAVEDRNRREILYLSSEELAEEGRHTLQDPLPISWDERSELRGTFEMQEPLWILPDLDILIRITGTTLDQMAGGRARRNLMFIGLVTVILILGLVTLLRNVSKEVSLARMKTDFVANVSHELRTPLALIRMYAETLEMGRVVSEQKKRTYYRTMMNESTRLTQLINNILDFSKIESRKKEFHFERTDLSQLVGETIEMYSYHLEHKGFQLQSEVQVGLPEVRVDRGAVTLAFINLLDNAVKFSPEKKTLIVSLQEQDGELVLSVKDRGIGIPSAEQKRIFDKFYRVGSSLVHDTKGSGLGLSLVKHIMEVHGGNVTVESKPGEGSTFSLIFPLD